MRSGAQEFYCDIFRHNAYYYFKFENNQQNVALPRNKLNYIKYRGYPLILVIVLIKNLGQILQHLYVTIS